MSDELPALLRRLVTALDLAAVPASFAVRHRLKRNVAELHSCEPYSSPSAESGTFQAVVNSREQPHAMLHASKMKRLVAALVFGGLAFALSQCSSSKDTASSSKGTASPREPLVHFATPQVCAASDAASFGPDCTDATTPGCACTTDPNNPCPAGPNGVCVTHGNALNASWCQYDLCASSNDCTAGSTCLCSGTKPNVRANRCVPSNCRVDADCGAGGYCSPSVEQPDSINCGTAGYYGGSYCHTPQDDCTSDSDCSAPAAPTKGGSGCAYNVEQGKWTCETFSCFAG